MSYDSEYWYVRDAGNVAGPFPRAEVMARWNRGELEWYHEVSQDQLIWVSASTLGNPDLDVSDPGPAKTPKILSKRRSMWTAAVLVVCIGAVVAVVWGFPYVIPNESQYTDAILRVLKEDDRITKETMSSLSSNATPSAYVAAIGRYLNQVQALNMSDCPPDFRVAFKEHFDCWIDLRTALREIPEDFAQGFFVGFINSYLFNEKDGGLKRMANNVQQASRNVRTSYRNVEEIAAKYGAAL